MRNRGILTALILLLAGSVAHGQTPSSTILAVSPDPSVYGQPVTLKATVTSGATGKVTFYDGTAVLGTSTITANQASLTTSLLAAGSRSIRAYYEGDGSYAPSTSTSTAATVVAKQSFGFHRPTTFNPVSYTSNSIAVGDFNGDGKLDFASLTSANNSLLSVSIGNGDGTFKPPVSYVVGSTPNSVVAGDFDGDGNVDLAVANYYGASVSTLLGNGDGTFRSATNTTFSSYPAVLAVGDFDGDGNADLAVSSGGYGYGVGILLGKGDGTFRAPVMYAITGYVSTVAIADLNSDGKPDLVVGGSGTISILRGNGDGTFQTPVTTSLTNSHSSLVIADFNGDGKLDIAANNREVASISFLAGNGDTTFQPVVTYPLGAPPRLLAAGDFNGDGKTDIFVATDSNGSSNPSGSVLLFSNGDGTFQTGSLNTNVQWASAAAVADFNGDGYADVLSGATLASNYALAMQLGGAVIDLSVTQGHGSGLTQGQVGAQLAVTVTNSGEIASNGGVGMVASLASGITATSISGNGWFCVLATLTCTRSDSLGALSSFPVITITVNVSGTATGSAANFATVSGGGDMNGTNNISTDAIFLRYKTTVSGSASPSPGTLGHSVTLTATVTSGATGTVSFYDGSTLLGTATLSGGQANLITFVLPQGARTLYATYSGDANYGPNTSASWTETITATTSTSLWPTASYKTGGSACASAMADFNHDGRGDLVLANNGSSPYGISVLIGNPDGTFQAPVSYTTPYGGCAVVTADFNRDGNIDVAVGSNSSIYLFLGKADGTFQSAVSVATPSLNALYTADLNGDGNADLVSVSNGSPVILFGKGDGTFQSSITLSRGTSYYSYFTLADVNGDGKPDILGLNASYNWSVGVFINNGDGTFQLPVDYTDSSSYYPMAFAAGDFNGDGKQDVAVIYWSGIVVLPGKGDGTFGTLVKTNSTTNTPGYVMVAGDFNGDGKLDLAYGGYYNSQMYTSFGNGDGTFRSGATLVTDSTPNGILLGDFDGNGLPDVAVSNSAGTVNIYLGSQLSALVVSLTHTGTFTASQTGTYQAVVTNPTFVSATGTVTVSFALPTGFTATALTGDYYWTCTLNTLTCTRSDGLSSGISYNPIRLTVSVASTLPAGTVNMKAFVTNANVQTGATDPTKVVLFSTVSLTSTPNPSIIGQNVSLTATVNGGTGTIDILDAGVLVGTATLSAGQATVSLKTLPAGSRQLVAVYSGDLTHAVGVSPVRVQTVNTAQASGFSAGVNYASGTTPYSVASGDLNGDGVPDLVTANYGSNTVSLLFGNGDGTYRTKVDLAVGTRPSAVVVGDFNGDGINDIATANQGDNTVSVLLGSGSGAFQTAVTYATSAVPTWLATGDFNGDGKVDLVVANNSAGTIGVLVGNGDGTFRTGYSITAYYPSALAVGDFNGDGKSDIVYANPYSIYILTGNGDGTFTSTYAGVSGYNGLYSMAAADLNGDGKVDIVAADNSGYVEVFLGKGDGTFQGQVSYAAGSSLLGIAVGDVNGDGKLDVIAANASGNTVSILLGNGNGTLQSATTYPAGSQPRSIAVGDFNGDGRTDIAIANSQSNNVTVFLGVLTPVLAVTSTHRGAFAPGQTGATYTVTVSNNGPGLLTGTITMTDTLPTGITATAISGTGWTCTPGTLSCSRTEQLAAGASFPPITVTVNVSLTAPTPGLNLVSASGGNAISGAGVDTTVIGNLTVDSVTPSSGLGYAQTFAISVSEPLGASAISEVYVIVNGSFSYASGCFFEYYRPTNTIWLANDADSAWQGATAVGSGAPISNSQCTISGTGASVTLIGNQLTLNVPVTFKAAFGGAKNMYVFMDDNAGLNTGWQNKSTWTVPAANTPPSIVSLTPSSGSGSTQTFSLTASDVSGGAAIREIYMIVNGTFSYGSGCFLEYYRPSNTIWLANDGDTAWQGSTVLGSSTTVSNSQCTVGGSGSSATINGNQLTLNLPVIFKSGFGGAKNVYAYVSDTSNLNTGWQTAGTWTVPVSTAPPTVVSVSPSSGSGSSQTFAITVSDAAGASAINDIYVVVNSTFTYAGCFIQYHRPSNTLWLANDADTAWAGSAAVGSNTSVSNNQCGVTGVGALVTTNGNQLILNLPITFKPAFAGTKTVYVYTDDYVGQNSGWQTAGSWTIPSGSVAPSVNSVNPSSGSGSLQTFSFAVVDPSGYQSINDVYVMINNGFSYANGCFLYYYHPTRTIYLANDADSAWAGGTQIGSSTVVSNSQCSVTGAGALAVGYDLSNGGNLTLSVPVTFKTGFAGAKNVYAYVGSSGGRNSGWQSLGTWTVPGAGSGPSLVSITPSSGTGTTQKFAITVSDPGGQSAINEIYVTVNNGFSYAGGCFVYYYKAANSIWLANDADTAWVGSTPVGSATSVSNSQCTAGGTGGSVTSTGNQFTLNLPLTFKPAFTGLKSIYVWVSNTGGANSGWQLAGTWTPQ